MSFDKIFTHGSMVDIDVGTWTGERKLKSEDIGLEKENLPETFSLGHRKLVPAEVLGKFKHLDYLVRSLLIRYSFPADFGQARFVPKKAFAAFAQEFCVVQAEFYQEVDKLIANLPTYRIEMRKVYTEAANQAYERLCSLCGYSKPRDEYINEYLERIEKDYPTAEKIRKKYRMEYVVFHVSLPDLTQASYEDLAEDSEKVNLMREAYQKAMSKRVERFVEGIVGSLRSNAVTVMSRVATNIKEGKKVTEATLRSLTKLLDDYDRMDVVGDTFMIERLRDLKTHVLDHVTAKQMSESSKMRDALRKDLEAIVSLAEDDQAIKALADGYRQRIGM